MSRKRKAPKAEPEEDWRSTLFFWRGELSEGAWAGTWVGTLDPAAPTAAQHAASAATFSAALAPPAGPDALQGLACAVASRYQLDQGDGAGLQEYTDEEHHLVVAAAAAAAGAASAPAAAAGANNFGAFVSVGRVVAGGAEGAPAVLTLARRYVRKGDARASLRGEQGARAVLEQYARAGGGAEPAWQEALPLFVPAARKGAKKGASESDAPPVNLE